MNTKVVTIKEDHIDEEAIQEARQILKNGGLVAFPTETVYGLGGDALNPDSRIFCKDLCGKGQTVRQSADCPYCGYGCAAADCSRDS